MDRAYLNEFRGPEDWPRATAVQQGRLLVLGCREYEIIYSDGLKEETEFKQKRKTPQKPRMRRSSRSGEE
jgi:hypothetical protein